MRVTSDVHLVGSLPAKTSEEAFRLAADLFADRLAAVPDGETGDRAGWVRFEGMTLTSPALEREPGASTERGKERYIGEIAEDRIRPGQQLHWETWPRITAAISSYWVFSRLRDEGVIPPGVRFQLGLPFPFSALGARFREPGHYQRAAEAYTDMAERELERLFSEVPARDLAIQWELASEVQDMHGKWPATWNDREGAWERFAAPASRLPRLVPPDALLGVHLCNGTFPEAPMYEPNDMSVMVTMANHLLLVTRPDRPVDWLHMPGPRYLSSTEPLYYRPLGGLTAGEETRVFLGLSLPADGAAGLRRRVAAAAPYLRAGFGVGAPCGFGREQQPYALQVHAQAVDSYLAGPQSEAEAA